MKINTEIHFNYDRANNKVIDALCPELKREVCKIDNRYWIHSPLFIIDAIHAYDPAQLNAAYLKKKALAEQFLANIRFDPMAYLVLIEKPYRLNALIEIRNRISDAQYWRCLAYAWAISEYTHQNKWEWLNLFRSERRYRALMMVREDRKYFDALPDTLTIYRGYQQGKHKHKMGLAWSLSKEKAIWFAYRKPENGRPMVVSGVCRKADAICFTNGRKEQEIIIDPALITRIKNVKDIGPSPFRNRQPGSLRQ